MERNVIPWIGSMEMAIVCVVVRGDSIDCNVMATGAVVVDHNVNIKNLFWLLSTVNHPCVSAQPLSSSWCPERSILSPTKNVQPPGADEYLHAALNVTMRSRGREMRRNR